MTGVLILNLALGLVVWALLLAVVVVVLLAMSDPADRDYPDDSGPDWRRPPQPDPPQPPRPTGLAGLPGAQRSRQPARGGLATRPLTGSRAGSARRRGDLCHPNGPPRRAHRARPTIR
ncbi:MAG TPA: hypothetical protein VG371_04265 [Solirubrobacteraceae bacterium]|nr:hypothetical protein [Solirubrobacteraceae bacterium]